MAACLQGSLLVRFAPPEVADAFCGSRLGGEYGGTLGTLTSSPADLARDRRPHHPGGRLIRAQVRRQFAPTRRDLGPECNDQL